jgi:hypothetical protein
MSPTSFVICVCGKREDRAGFGTWPFFFVSLMRELQVREEGGGGRVKGGEEIRKSGDGGKEGREG